MKILIIALCLILTFTTILSQNTEIQDEQESGRQRERGKKKHNHQQSDDLKVDQVDINSPPIISPVGTDEQSSQILEPRLAPQDSVFPVIPPGTPPSAVCNLQMDPGPCRAGYTRFYYVASTSECELFLFGGCEGNYNNFATYDECMQYCSPGYSPQIPMLPGFNTKGIETKLAPTNPMYVSPDVNNNNNDNGSSSGNRHHHHRWPLFGGLLAGFYSLLRHLFYW